MKENIIPPHQQFKKKVYSYCCLNHYIQGKNTKGATFCYTHKPLGVINPISTLNKVEQDRLFKTKNTQQNIINHVDVENLVVNARQFNLKNHTHYLNQIEGKQSLPKRLVYPREYIQKINKKNALNKDQYILSNYNNRSFQEIYDLFLKFAKVSQFSTEKDLKNDIMNFARQNNIKIQPVANNQFNLGKTQVPHILFQKQNFLTYLQKVGMTKQDAQHFWNISYNKDRFSLTQKMASNILMVQTEYVSMRAFIYNFKKFYLDECAQYKNMFSQAALRQRLINLRLFLQPWYQRNIYIKVNMIEWKNQELDICSFFKKSGFQDEFSQLVDLISQRNKEWFILRTFAKCFYCLTDKKNIGLNELNNRVADLIQQKTQSLICCMEFVSKFKQYLVRNQLNQQLNQNQEQSNKINSGQQFIVTELIQFLDKTKKQFQVHQQAWIVKWIKQIYKYLYFFKGQEYPSLFFDHQSLKLVCTGQVKINRSILEQFVAYKNKQIDQFMELISTVSDQINQKVHEMMPQLQGNKKHLVQCNFVAETLLRIIKRQNLYIFYQLYEILNIVKKYGSTSQYHQCINQLQSLIKTDPYKDKLVPDHFWKKYFVFINQNQNSQSILDQKQSVSNIQNEPKYRNAYQNYQQIKKVFNISQQPVSIYDKRQKDKNQPNLNLKANSKTDKYVKKISAQRQNTGQKLQQIDWNQRKSKNTCSHSNGYCSLCNQIISTQVSSVVSQVQSMQSYLMNLLSI